METCKRNLVSYCYVPTHNRYRAFNEKPIVTNSALYS